jgi:hypothetical protein
MSIDYEIDDSYRWHRDSVIFVLQSARDTPVPCIANRDISEFSVSDLFGGQPYAVSEVQLPETRPSAKGFITPDHGAGGSACKYDVLVLSPDQNNAQKRTGCAIVVEPGPQMPGLISSIEIDDISLVD